MCWEVPGSVCEVVRLFCVCFLRRSRVSDAHFSSVRVDAIRAGFRAAGYHHMVLCNGLRVAVRRSEWNFGRQIAWL